MAITAVRLPKKSQKKLEGRLLFESGKRMESRAVERSKRDLIRITLDDSKNPWPVAFDCRKKRT
jgi:hypothetical protein